MTREAIWRFITPRWRRHLERLVERERPDAVVVFTVPMAHFRGIPTALRDRFDVPVVFYDGDVPMSLPEFGGMDTGFNYYHGADPGEYDLVVSNSEGGPRRCSSFGARRAETIFWGADPDFFAPQPVEKEFDVFFYGYGDKFRREWMSAFVGEPSRELGDVDFALGGHDFRSDTGTRGSSATSRSRVSAGDLGGASQPLHHAPPARHGLRLVVVPAFELAASGAAIVANPYDGIERWFEPGSELMVVDDADEAIAAYRALLDDPGQAEEMGRRARERVLDEHTYRHRARRLLELLDLKVAAVSTEMAEAPSLTGAPLAAVSARDRARLQRGAEPAAADRELRELDPGLEVVVVSDGSTDRTADVAAAAGAHIVQLPFNLGIGGAVQTGFRFAWEDGYTLAVRLTATASTTPPSFARDRARWWPTRPTLRRLALPRRGRVSSSAARRIGIRVLAAVVSAIAHSGSPTRPRAFRR